MSSNGVLTRLKSQDAQKASSPYALKAALAQKLRGGVVIEVASPRQARIAEAAGAVAVVALGTRPPPGGVSRMSDPELIREIKAAVRIPVIGSARIGHFVEAQILQVIGVDFIDESEVLTPADDTYYINKHKFRIPFVCGCCNLGDALRRVAEGAAIVRAKGEAGTGNVVEAVRHVRSVLADIRKLQTLHGDEIYSFARQLRAPFELVKLTKQLGRLPAVNFGAGGVATPADAAMMMQLGCDGVFVESEIFNSGDPAMRIRAIVRAVTHYNDSRILAEVSSNLGEAVVG